jgi:hypothetical protein
MNTLALIWEAVANSITNLGADSVSWLAIRDDMSGLKPKSIIIIFYSFLLCWCINNVTLYGIVSWSSL